MNNKKNNKSIGKIVVELILIVFLIILGFFAYTKLLNTPDKSTITSLPPDSSYLIEGNTFGFNGLVCKNKTDTSCTKDIKLAYNKKNHNISIIRNKTKSSNAITYRFEIYLDDKLIDNIDGGVSYELKNNTSSDIDFDGYIYVVEDRYIALVLPFVVESNINYIVYYYENGIKIDKGIDLINAAQKISNKEDTLNDLDALEFDGKILKYYKAFCPGKQKSALQIGITVENNALLTKYLKTVSNVTIKGACN